MAKKQSKVKGPKGKKARAKAKLERQWGEVELGEKTKRVGKSRLLARQNNRRQDSEPQQIHEDSDGNDNDNANVEGVLESQENNKEEMSDDEEQACSRLLQSLRQETGDDSSVDSSEDGGDDDLDMEIDAKDSQLPANLLQMNVYSERFSGASPVPVNEEERNQQINDIQSPQIDFRLSKSVSLQVSQSLARKLEFNHESDLLAQCKIRAKALIQSPSVRKLLQDQCPTTSTTFQTLFPLAALYADMLVTSPHHSNDHTVYAVHILNHVLTARGRVQRHNRRLQTIDVEDEQQAAGDDDPSDWQRDQGYTRPTVLVLLPTRGCCYEFIKQLQALLNDSAGNDRFESEFGPPSMDGIDLNDPKEQHRRKAMTKKGNEWLDLFGDDVNDDDDFKIGISLQENKHKKRNEDENSWSVKLFSDFYKSDIIVASPLGLKMNANSKEDDERGFLFLSSIEICLVLRSDVLLMQNWDHVNDLLPELNQQPQDTTDIDFGRVRNYLLDGHAAHWRQLIISSSFIDPAIVSTFKRHAKSIAGIARVRHKADDGASSIAHVVLPTQQVFQRVSTSSFLKQSEERVKYFTDKVLDPILRNKQKHTLIFIPSYFDFVSVRNRLLKEEASFVMVTEYSRHTETSRARARFLQGRKPIMLYTGRAHFFYRHLIKGARHVVFLGLPEYPEFYSQLVNLLNEGLDAEDDTSSSSLALFTKFDKFALERIVGYRNSNNMLHGEKSTFLFT